MSNHLHTIWNLIVDCRLNCPVDTRGGVLVVLVVDLDGMPLKDDSMTRVTKPLNSYMVLQTANSPA